MEHPLIGLAGIVIVGIAAQWLSWRLRLPAIFLLLLAGFVAGGVTGWIDPDELLGATLFPIVSLSVAIILFEGGLSLDIAELAKIGRVVRNLASIGVVATWVLSAIAARFLLGFDWPLSALLGAILVVTGPTVIIPLLRHIRPTAKLGSAIRWEAIVNDPTGAILAVLVFNAIVVGEGQEGISAAVLGVVKALGAGGALGLAGAGLIVLLLKRYWVPDFLQSPVTLAVVMVVFSLSDLVLSESGLLAVTVMGSALASQNVVTVRHIVEFKENLRVLLISALFVILAARLPISDPAYSDPGSLWFLAVLILVVRPASVALSTIGTFLTWRERVFLGFMAPRGIVAAAVASIFSLELMELGYPGAEKLAPVMFLVIVGTVALYGLGAGRVARWLGVATPNPQGMLLLGASGWVRAVAQALKAEGVEVTLVDSNRKNVAQARQDGLEAKCDNILAEYAFEDLELDGIGRFLALTPNDEVNSLATVHASDVFERSNVYQLAPEGADEGGRLTEMPAHLQGRILFDTVATHAEMTKRFAQGATIKRTGLTDEFGFDEFVEHYRGAALPLFVVTEASKVRVLEAQRKVPVKAGQTIISLVFDGGEPRK
ncbi:MAG: sodium:proton antiporter [Gemmatimonadetes bacterium]|nr:sodium:proton antiporter [Gemmatimonadota bacterium]